MTTKRVDKRKYAIASALAATFALSGAGSVSAVPTETGAEATDSRGNHAFAAQPRHGYVGNDESDVTARQAMDGNTGLGAIEWEPQSLEAPKGFPEGGPEDGKIASAGTSIGKNLDEQSSTRWVKNSIRPGEINIGWNFTAPHKTSKWHYYITKTGWDQNAPLERSAFEPLATVEHDGSPASANSTHTVTIPEDHSGYHVILAVWDVADTDNAFYNVIDVDIDSNHPDNPGTDPEDPEVPEDPDSGTDPEDPEDPDTDPDVPEDDGAPSAPQYLHSMGTTDDSVDLMWSESTGPMDLSHYEILRSEDGAEFEPVGTTENTSFLDTGLSPETRYQYKVVAHDVEGNTSASSNVLTVTTEATDEAPDTEPTWDPRGSYKAGDRVTHDGNTYEAVESHTGNGDPTWIHAPSLWKKL